MNKTLKLNTLVIKRRQEPTERINNIVEPRDMSPSAGTFESLGDGSDSDFVNIGNRENLAGSIVSSTMELSEGERMEVENEEDTEITIMAMPFAPLKPIPSSARMNPSGNSWGIEAIGVQDRPPSDGEGVVVAVLDTGIDIRHPCFSGMNIETRNFTNDDDIDTDGHGTHCAGTIFGQDHMGTRIGIARGIEKALIGKVIGRSSGSSGDIFDALLWAKQEGAHVVSMSLGIDFPGFRERLVTEFGLGSKEATSIALAGYRQNIRMFDGLSNLFARDIGVSTPLIIAAAGNESSRPSYTITSAPPAVAEDILSVGALDNALQVATFSNTDPDISAPGVDIWSAKANSQELVALSGTSMAAPHVAGVAALKSQKMIAENRFDSSELKDILKVNVTPLPGVRRDVGRGMVRL